MPGLGRWGQLVVVAEVEEESHPLFVAQQARAELRTRVLLGPVQDAP